MRIAVFSDIHGNPFATEAVLASIRSEGEFHAVVAAGDLCSGGSDPSRCVDLLRADGVRAVYGNVDRYVVEPDVVPPDELHRSQWDEITQRVAWVRAQLGPDRIEWLAALPFSIQFNPIDHAADGLLVVHANPKNVEDMIFPPPAVQERVLGAVRQPDDDPGLETLLSGVTARVIAFGHHHFTSQRTWRDKLLVNVSPCSLPAIDGDPRARYTIFEWQDTHWGVTQRHVEYDYRREVSALMATDMPFREKFAAMFVRQ